MPFPVNARIRRRTRLPLALGQEQVDCSRVPWEEYCIQQRLYDPEEGEEGLKACARRERVKCEAMQYAGVQKALAAIKPEDYGEYAKQMEKAIKKEAIKGAVMNAGLQLSLMAIPAVGQALSALVGVVTAYTGKKYQARLEDYMKQQQASLKAFVEGKQKELNTALDNAYEWAYRKSAPLAVSWQPLEILEENLKNFLNPYTTGMDGLGNFIDDITGKSMWDEGRKRIDEIMRKQKAEIEAQVRPIINKVKTEGFKVLLAKKLAIEIRRHPQFMEICRKLGVPPPSRFVGMGEKVSLPDVPTIAPKPIGSTEAQRIPSSGGAQAIPVKEGSALPTTGTQRLPSTSDQIKWAEGMEVPKETNILPLVGAGGAAIAAILLLSG